METTNQLSQKACIEFRDIYRKEFDVLPSDSEVQETGLRLLRLFSLWSSCTMSFCDVDMQGIRCFRSFP